MSTTTLAGGRGILPAPAAASIHRIDAQLGRLVPITEAGRTYERQLYLYTQYVNGVPGFNRALHPDNPLANHVIAEGRRGAIDTEAVRLGVISEAAMNAHGWYRTAADEYWHYEYFEERDTRRGTTAPALNGKDYGMEFYILREDGTVFHITPVKAYAFKDVKDYNAWRNIVKASGVKTSLLTPPAITSLKKWPAWRVKAIADRMGVALPR